MNYDKIKSNINTICLKTASVADLPVGSMVILLRESWCSTKRKPGTIGIIVQTFSERIYVDMNGDTVNFTIEDIDEWLAPV